MRIVALLLIIGARLVTAQSTSVRVADVVGVVTDTSSNQLLGRVRVCSNPPSRLPVYMVSCVPTDINGAFKLASLPLGAVRISIVCDTMRGLGKALAADTVMITDAGTVKRNWIVSTSGCDSRTIRYVTRTFRGHYTGGFEESEFVPCPQDAWFLPGDSLDTYPYDARSAWVEIPKNIVVKWPKNLPHNSWGSAQAYVRWHGTVTGPGRFGHMSVGLFQMQVDSVLEIRAPRSGDCR